ncbi:MAG: hypothetical protein ACD_3C00186G0001, partial [uncultured bacterium (gcode 4)]
MLELNLTWLQTANSAQDPIQEDGIIDQETPVQETPAAEEKAETQIIEAKKPKISLSLNSLMWKSEDTDVVPAEQIQVEIEKEEPLITEARAEETPVIEVITEEPIIKEESAPEDAVSEKEESSSVLSLTTLKETEEEIKKEDAAEAKRKAKSLIEEKKPEEEKKEFFPSFNALWDFGNDDILGINKKEEWIQGESISIFTPLEAEKNIATEEVAIESPASPIAEPENRSLEINGQDPIEGSTANVAEDIQSPNNPEDIEVLKEELSKKRLFAGLTPFKKKILIYSISIFAVGWISLIWFLWMNRDASDIKASVSEIKLPPIIYKEWVDYNVIKNGKKNTKRIKTPPETTIASGATDTWTAPDDWIWIVPDQSEMQA